VTASLLVEPGLCSVTLRRLTVDSVVELAATATLSSIEWGSDVHVPVGDLAAAKRAARATSDAGLRVAAYGSCFRPGVQDVVDFIPVLDSARTLGAPRIRIWAGDTGSAESTAEQHRAVVATTRAVAEQAADAGIELAFETRPGTLTDAPASTERLLAEVDRPNVLAYWQPPVAASDAHALAGLTQLLPKVAAVHVFSWRPGQGRYLLSARAELWRGVVDRLTSLGRQVDVFVEFVPNDDPIALRRESSSLRDMLSASVARLRRVSPAV